MCVVVVGCCSLVGFGCVFLVVARRCHCSLRVACLCVIVVDGCRSLWGVWYWCYVMFSCVVHCVLCLCVVCRLLISCVVCCLSLLVVVVC